jgi:alkaline phosphatase/alkaline phosphatase D
MRNTKRNLSYKYWIILSAALMFSSSLSAQQPRAAGARGAGDTRQKILELLAHPEHSQGEMAGHMTTTTALLQTRLTLTNQAFNHDYIGCPGWACFEYTDGRSRTQTQRTAWLEARAANDYIVKVKLEGLKPNTTYYYRLLYGPDKETWRTGHWCEFKTLPGKDESTELGFVVVTGMNYERFYYSPGRKYLGIDKYNGFPAAEQVLKLQPDFFVGTGDNVYYDSPAMPIGEGIDEASIRNYYHLQFSRPRMVELFSNVGSYWEKDDHDYRWNDCDTVDGGRPPSHELGIRMFKEQLPVTDPDDPGEVTFKTYRVSRELQFWLVENRDYRSPNNQPDGPDKTIWGEEQEAWLKRTLKESDAVFKVLISPDPMIGPDDAYKRDNHVNHQGFRQEGQEFFRWLKREGFGANESMIICGDRHWQYHAIDPTGYSEFSTGAFVDANSRMGRNPGDPESTDPQAEILQPFTSPEASGGFLQVRVEPEGSPWKTPRIIFDFFNEKGEVLHTTFKDTPAE